MNQQEDVRRAPVRATSWVFCIIPDKKKEGLFYIQPIRPDARQMPNVIIRAACRAVKDASRTVTKLRDSGSIDRLDSMFAKTVEQKLADQFGHLVPIEVIFQEELFSRARDGEFQLRVSSMQDMKRDNRRFRNIQGHVHLPAPTAPTPATITQPTPMPCMIPLEEALKPLRIWHVSIKF